MVLWVTRSSSLTSSCYTSSRIVEGGQEQGMTLVHRSSRLHRSDRAIPDSSRDGALLSSKKTNDFSQCRLAPTCSCFLGGKKKIMFPVARKEAAICVFVCSK